MPYSSPRGIIAPSGPDPYPSELWWKRLADSVDVLLGRAQSAAAQAASDVQRAAAAAQAVAIAGGLQPPVWDVVDARYMRQDRAFVNVQDHGVIGDGRTDDTAAMRAALAAVPGGTVWIPSHLNVLTTDTLVPTRGATLTGGGRVTCSSTRFGSYAFDVSDVHYVTFRNLTIQGSASVAIMASNAANLTVDGCRIGQHASGVYGGGVTHTGEWLIVNNTFSSAASTGYALEMIGQPSFPFKALVANNRFYGGYAAPKVYATQVGQLVTRDNVGALPGSQAGLASTTAKPTLSGSVTIQVTYPVPYLTPPSVVATPANARLNVGITAVTATGCALTVANWSPALTADATTQVHWMAFPGTRA